MYCVKCGAELSDGERKCPLCLTPVYYPGYGDGEPHYPPVAPKEDKINLKGLNFVFTVATLLAGLIAFFVDLDTGNDGITWSWLVLGALGVFYTATILPLWFVRRTPAIFAPIDFIAVGLYLWLVCGLTDGSWYLTLALPVTGAVALIMCSVLILVYYLRCGYLYIAGGACIALGLVSVMIEWLIHVTFTLPAHPMWSLYPAILLGGVGLMLIVIEIVKPLKESLARIFAI